MILQINLFTSFHDIRTILYPGLIVTCQLTYVNWHPNWRTANILNLYLIGLTIFQNTADSGKNKERKRDTRKDSGFTRKSCGAPWRVGLGALNLWTAFHRVVRWTSSSRLGWKVRSARDRTERTIAIRVRSEFFANSEIFARKFKNFRIISTFSKTSAKFRQTFTKIWAKINEKNKKNEI